MRRLAILTALAALALPATAPAAPPKPFGHTCTPKNGARFCATQSDSQRVASFDGVPLDVDVTLPPSGDGPFPTIVMLHGYPGTKESFETETAEGRTADGSEPSTLYHYNNVFYALRGYAVVNYSARGFGRSCGSPDSRGAGCERGWLHLGDQRFEVRDTQHLLGLLVDQGVAKPGALGVTGMSYGGGQSIELARLKGAIRTPGGDEAPWRSPAGTELEIEAAYSRWGWSDLVAALVPNGRFVDFRGFRPGQSRLPVGVGKDSYVEALFQGGKATGFVAPAGADPSADLETWKRLFDSGRTGGSAVKSSLKELFEFHSAVSLFGVPAPLLIQNGWTDDLFPPEQALRIYNPFLGISRARISLQAGDLGHSRGSNKLDVERRFNDDAAAFFDAYLKRTGEAPDRGSVTAFTQTCPRTAAAGGPYEAASWRRLHPGAFRFGSERTQRVRSSGGNPDTARAFDPIGGTDDACKTVDRERAKGTAVYQRKVRRSFTLLGFPTVRAGIRARGDDGQIAARLWDVSAGEQLLVSRGVYRLTDDENGDIAFQLFGNGYRFRRGHRVKLELLGSDAGFLRPSNDSFSVRVSDLQVELPTRERPSRRRGLVKPRLAR